MYPSCIAAMTVPTIAKVMLFDQRLEAVEADGPEFLPLLQPAFGGLQRFGIEAAHLLAPCPSPFDESCAFEHLHVLRGAGEAHREGLTQLANGFVAEAEAREHPSPRRIGERMRSGTRRRSRAGYSAMAATTRSSPCSTGYSAGVITFAERASPRLTSM